MRGEKEEDIIGTQIVVVLVLVILLLSFGTMRVLGKIGICQKKILKIPIFNPQTSFICP
jgi:hypothetical protein